jgi:hypothetical protein
MVISPQSALWSKHAKMLGSQFGSSSTSEGSEKIVQPHAAMETANENPNKIRLFRRMKNLFDTLMQLAAGVKSIKASTLFSKIARTTKRCNPCSDMLTSVGRCFGGQEAQ